MLPEDSSTWEPLLSEKQFHPELDNPHIGAETADLAHARSIGNNGIITYEANVIRLPEIRRVCGIEQLGPKLDRQFFRKPEILEQGKAAVWLYGRSQNIHFTQRLAQSSQDYEPGQR
jgi:hypothetical protein